MLYPSNNKDQEAVAAGENVPEQEQVAANLHEQEERKGELVPRRHFSTTAFESNKTLKKVR